MGGDFSYSRPEDNPLNPNINTGASRNASTPGLGPGASSGMFGSGPNLRGSVPGFSSGGGGGDRDEEEEVEEVDTSAPPIRGEKDIEIKLHIQDVPEEVEEFLGRWMLATKAAICTAHPNPFSCERWVIQAWPRNGVMWQGELIRFTTVEGSGFARLDAKIYACLIKALPKGIKGTIYAAYIGENVPFGQGRQVMAYLYREVIQDQHRLRMQASRELGALECAGMPHFEEVLSRFETLTTRHGGRTCGDSMDTLRRLGKGIPEARVIMQTWLMVPPEHQYVKKVLGDLRRTITDTRYDDDYQKLLKKKQQSPAAAAADGAWNGGKGKGRGKGKGKKGGYAAVMDATAFVPPASWTKDAQG